MSTIDRLVLAMIFFGLAVAMMTGTTWFAVVQCASAGLYFASDVIEAIWSWAQRRAG